MHDMDDLFAVRMRRHREKVSKTQHQVAKAVRLAGHEFSRQTVYKIELGRRTVSVGEAFAIADALGVELTGLVGRSDYTPDAQHPAIKLLHEANEAMRNAMREIGGRDA